MRLDVRQVVQFGAVTSRILQSVQGLHQGWGKQTAHEGLTTS